MSPANPTPPPPTGRVAKRRALKLGLLASLFALVGRTTARAQDALTVEPDGTTIYAKYIDFRRRFGALLTLWSPGYEFGIQPATLYARSDKNFAWYKGGTYVRNDTTQIDPGGGGVTMMSLSDGVLTVSNKFSGKGAVPVGAILMWSGKVSELPAGWALCNGANNTPNLQDRFVVGYNPNNADYNGIGKTGGEAAHVLAMAEMPAHNHGPAGDHKHVCAWGKGIGDNVGFAWARNQGGTADPMNTAGAHTHVTQGDGRAHENRPPYYVLAYIMFTG